MGNIQTGRNMTTHFLMLILILLFAFLVRSLDISSKWQAAAMINLSLGFMLLAAFIVSQILKGLKLPLISGYIFTGILAGPFVTGFLTFEMVERFSLIDDLALSFIALAAGGELHLFAIKKQMKTISLNIIFLTILVFLMIGLFVLFTGRYFTVISDLDPKALMVLAILLSVICIARSPASAIAVINECKAKGPFTDMVLAIAIAKDVLIIILFTFAMGISKMILSGQDSFQTGKLFVLILEIIISIGAGLIVGKGISLYFDRIRHDFSLFLLFIAFSVTRISFWGNEFMVTHYDVSLHLEPLLICMSAGFFVQNFSSSGSYFVESLDRMSLPIYVLFFSLAGASLNLQSLVICWPLALSVVAVRIAGLFGGSWLAGTISHDPPIFNKCAWMAYITQAGVSIGLAQLAGKQFPEIAVLNTVVLATITINQILGPILFKISLGLVGEAGKR
ncbi:MAG: cation:proton antiporter [Desulfobacterales bacterium]|nr:cation:proton antiporter [Desulfobacterales bacterium]